jgi:hypothetical protein
MVRERAELQVKLIRAYEARNVKYSTADYKVR